MDVRVGCILLCVLLTQPIATDAIRAFSTRQQALAFVTAKPKDFQGNVWALLVAGSASWWNYRHQADVAHAYQVLKRGGLDDDHIVVMHADDIALDIQNPHRSQLFNKPGGPDVYAGLPKDYTGDAVTAENFLAVLRGEESTATILGTSGKVIQSSGEDRVFVYFADHGAPGILGMPTGPFLYADQLIGTLRNKSASNGYAEMVLYIEACESGSIFQGMLDETTPNVWATTAANAEESSWGTYCPGQLPGPPPEFNTCLGDLYSVSWLEDSDVSDLTSETLETQYERVKLRTSNNNTYAQGSHVLQFGARAIDEEPAADFLGALNKGSADFGNNMPQMAGWETVPQRQADLVPLRVAVQHARTAAEAVTAQVALDAELGRRRQVDASVRLAVSDLLQDEAVDNLMQTTYSHSQLAAAMGAFSNAAAPLVELIVTGVLPRAAALPLVDNWDCLRGMMNAWAGHCGMDQYAMQYSRAFANLCNAGLSVTLVEKAAQAACAVTSAH